MGNTRIFELAAALARELDARPKIARELAELCHAEDLLILTYDKSHSCYLPCCGFPQTLPGSRLWRSFASEVAANGQAAARLPFPTKECERVARGWSAADGSILVLFEGNPAGECVDNILLSLPLIVPAFEKERLAIFSSAEAKLSTQAAHQARKLAESLDAVRKQLQETIVLREKDIAERERVEAQLARTNRDLSRANEDLNQFTFAATHDIREPLRAISIYVQLLEKELRSSLSETAQEYVTFVLRGTKRISNLLDGLLQFSRLGGADPVKRFAISAETALREAVDDLAVSIGEAGALVTWDSLPVVLADELHLNQLFQNLLANAMKYRHPDRTPEVHVSAKPQDGFRTFSIKDNGIGISSEYHDLIFLPFKRLHASQIAGAGIGLATCKRIVERYGGTIWVESEEGKGSTFYFSLLSANLKDSSS